MRGAFGAHEGAEERKGRWSGGCERVASFCENDVIWGKELVEFEVE